MHIYIYNIYMHIHNIHIYNIYNILYILYTYVHIYIYIYIYIYTYISDLTVEISDLSDFTVEKEFKQFKRSCENMM